MLTESIIRDLAIVLVIAAVVAFIFHRLQQPIVLGYIIAGIIIGPYTPPFSYLSQPEVFSSLAELGVILLLFGIGLTFPVSKLFKLGRVSLVVGAVEISVMMLFSVAAGRLLSWPLTDSLFLGIALSSSSTAIIAKCLTDMGKLGEESCDIMLGVLIVEDLAVVVMLAGVQSVFSVGVLSMSNLILLLGKIVMFIGGSLLVGWRLVIPFMDRVRRESTEVLVVMAVGLCFAYSIAAYLCGFSVAIGAFISGVVLAGWEGAGDLLKETLTLRDVFGSIFFVSVGALMDVSNLGLYVLPVLAITLVMLAGKVVGCSLGTYISGFSWTTSLRVGLGMAQIGEFAFIVVKVGDDLGVLSTPLFAIVGVVAILTTFLTPYLIKFSYSLGERVPAARRVAAVE